MLEDNGVKGNRKIKIKQIIGSEFVLSLQVYPLRHSVLSNTKKSYMQSSSQNER